MKQRNRYIGRISFNPSVILFTLVLSLLPANDELPSVPMPAFIHNSSRMSHSRTAAKRSVLYYREFFKRKRKSGKMSNPFRVLARRFLALICSIFPFNGLLHIFGSLFLDIQLFFRSFCVRFQVICEQSRCRSSAPSNRSHQIILAT